MNYEFKRVSFDELSSNAFSDKIDKLLGGEELQRCRETFELYVNCDFWVRVIRNNAKAKYGSREVYIHRMEIRRKDLSKNVLWMDKFSIKNKLIGEEYDAVERFPPNSELFDNSNAYHLFVLSDPKLRFPYFDMVENKFTPKYPRWSQIAPRAHNGFMFGDGI